MHARVVRFTGVTPERIAEVTARVEEADGPPPGVDSTRMQLLVDSEQKMRDASAVFEQMDPSETPGTRASVDLCEVKLERDVSQG